MGVRFTTNEGVTALFDSVSGWAFGPVFEDSEQSQDFLDFHEKTDDRHADDLRSYTIADLESLHKEWLQARGTARCTSCSQPATHRVRLHSQRSDRVLSDSLLCDQHTAKERTLRDSGMSMARVEIEKL